MITFLKDNFNIGLTRQAQPDLKKLWLFLNYALKEHDVPGVAEARDGERRPPFFTKKIPIPNAKEPKLLKVSICGRH